MVLDVCCGSRMFWFDRENPTALFMDKRAETHELTDSSSQGGFRSLTIAPEVQADFTALPFRDASFPMVVFDPPHLVRNGKSGWLAKKYGKLGRDWREEIRAGFAESFRVLRPLGTLIFKWNEHEIPVSQVVALSAHRPLFGNKCGKQSKSHWLVFLKPAQPARRAEQDPTVTHTLPIEGAGE
jgi:SAM-dependent methyltransferase